ncbi:MAG TPA: GlsB/YeaQ/YmgE family stress response membrane protein [bacterium]|nr:GlsB/YeaQ/YmgE family stress response membrane protein [bacterium]
MSILAWIIVGIIAGWLAKKVIPGEGPGGVLGDLVIGVIGAIVGGWIFSYFGHPGATGLNIGSIIVAFVGAVIVLWLMRLVTGRGSARA